MNEDEIEADVESEGEGVHEQLQVDDAVREEPVAHGLLDTGFKARTYQ